VPTSEDGYWLVVVGSEYGTLAVELENLRLLGYVVDVTKLDGSVITGAVMGQSEAALILEGWDNQAGYPNGELVAVDMDTIAGLWVP
jgi:hypothetical protein